MVRCVINPPINKQGKLLDIFVVNSFGSGFQVIFLWLDFVLPSFPYLSMYFRLLMSRKFNRRSYFNTGYYKSVFINKFCYHPWVMHACSVKYVVVATEPLVPILLLLLLDFSWLLTLFLVFSANFSFSLIIDLETNMLLELLFACLVLMDSSYLQDPLVICHPNEHHWNHEITSTSLICESFSILYCGVLTLSVTYRLFLCFSFCLYCQTSKVYHFHNSRHISKLVLVAF